MAVFETNATTTSAYGDQHVSYQAIIQDEIKDALMATVVTPAFLDFHDLSGSPSRSVKIPKADKFTASAVAEGTELTNTVLTVDSVTIGSSEVGIMATVTDVLELSDIPAAHGSRLRQLGRAMGDRMDIDVCSLFSAFSTSVGSTGSNLTLSNLLDVIYNLEVNDAASLGNVVCVLHPRQVADIREYLEQVRDVDDGGALSPVYTGANVPGKVRNAYFGSYFDIDIFTTTNVPTANAAADRGGAAFINNYALGMVQKWSTKVEMMRWPPIRGWVMVLSAMYGVGEIEDLAGVQVVTDA